MKNEEKRQYASGLSGSCSYQTVCRIGDVFYAVANIFPLGVRKFTVESILILGDDKVYTCGVEDMEGEEFSIGMQFPEKEFRKIMHRHVEEAEKDMR